MFASGMNIPACSILYYSSPYVHEYSTLVVPAAVKNHTPRGTVRPCMAQTKHL